MNLEDITEFTLKKPFLASLNLSQIKISINSFIFELSYICHIPKKLLHEKLTFISIYTSIIGYFTK